MINPDVPGFNPGGVKDRIDTRDYKWSEVGFGTAPFDWNVGYDIEAELRIKLNNPNFKFPVKDQDGSGSCGGQAWSYYGGALEAYYTGSFEERSAKFIYAQTYVAPAGSPGRENCIVTKNQGWAREAVLPSYDNGQPPGEAFMQRSQDISDIVRQDAARAKSLSYSNADVDIDTIARSIRDSKGIIIGIVGSNNGTWTSAFPNPPQMSEGRWYHWMYVGKAKILNGKKYIGALQSWGLNCGNFPGCVIGENGWQWISEDYIKTILPGDPYGRAIWSTWVLTYNTTPVPPLFTHNFQTPISLGQSGDEVVALQKALQIDGDFPISVPTTGFYGDITRRSVLKFQLKYKLDTPAVLNQLAGRSVGPKTRAHLNLLFNK